MRKLVFLFGFVFSPLALFCVSGHVGSPESDKSKRIEAIVNPETKTVKEENNCDSLAIAIKTLSNWQVASGSYYDPKDSSQTKESADGVGAFERMIQSGSIALGSSFTKFFLKEKDNIEVLFETNLNVVTPFGKGIFRLDDSSDKNPNNLSKKHRCFYFLDFNQEDLNERLKQIGRFSLQFRIYKIRKISQAADV